MRARKRRRLEVAGWRVGSAAEFLRLKPEEAALVEMKLNLARRLRDVRTNRGLSQEAMAKLLGSSQSRVAKMEAGDRNGERGSPGAVAPARRGIESRDRSGDQPASGVSCLVASSPSTASSRSGRR